jgi:hypothetical protein
MPDDAKRTAETAATAFHGSLTASQRKFICFDWDHRHPRRGLLRTHVSNFWHVSQPMITDDFYSRYQRALLFEVFRGVFNPDWHLRMLRQLRDDHDGLPWGGALSCGVLGEPGTEKFQLVMTGRHITIRVGNRGSHIALGGPIFHGHAPGGYTEKRHHPGNVFWHQARLANEVYTILDGKQQQQALVPQAPEETAVGFRDPRGPYPGLPCSDMTADQKAALQKVLLSLIEPYRQEDQHEVLACLARQGGLERCSLAFCKGSTRDGSEWENWRLEGPAFVWYFRGYPHVHIWINVADDPSLSLTSRMF